MEEQYKLNLSGPGVQVTRDLNREDALRVLSVLMGGSASSARGRPSPNPLSEGSEAGDQTEGSATIGEFIGGLNVKSNAERIAAIALYMDEEQGKRLVPKEDFPSLFQRSGEAPPKNLTRDLQTAVARRLVSEDHSRAGYYFVTKKGADLLRGTGSRTPSGTRKHSPGSEARETLPSDDDDGGAPASQKPTRRDATAKGKGPTARVLVLKAAGWLKTPRTVPEILAELARRGGVYERTDLTRLMITLVDREDLVRTKKVGAKGTRKVWHYSAS